MTQDQINERRLDMDRVQSQFEITLQSGTMMHNTMLTMANERSTSPLVDHMRNVAKALIKRTDSMRTNLERAQRHRGNDADAARQACLEQVQQQWKWFTWILDNQSHLTENTAERCPNCGLRKIDQHQESCTSCYDIEITNTVAKQERVE